MTETMQRIALARRPMGAPVDDDFLLENIPMPTPAEGEVLVKVHYMSLDPYMRGRMDDAKSYANPVPLGGTMEGGGVGQIVASNAADYAVGDYVFGMLGWASHACLKPKNCKNLTRNWRPSPPLLGCLGCPDLPVGTG
mgnify:CR=1 FL=1